MSGIPPRRDPEVAPAFRKDEAEERVLQRLNEALEPLEAELEQVADPGIPSVHLIGVPRSGTTLLMQLMCSCLDGGYVNNLIAAFWRAPLVGITLSRKVLGAPPPSSFASRFGRTAGAHEPHEFGYFWSRLLGYAEPQERKVPAPVDWPRVARVLGAMAAAFGRPWFSKSFHLGWHIEDVQPLLPRTCFVFIRRDPLASALSLLNMRRTFLGSQDRWASFRPTEYETLVTRSPWEQVAGQVYHLERSFARHAARARPGSVLEVAYEEVCARPAAFLAQVGSLIAAHGGTVRALREPPASFPPPPPLDHSDPDVAKIAGALERLREGRD